MSAIHHVERLFDMRFALQGWVKRGVVDRRGQLPVGQHICVPSDGGLLDISYVHV